MYYQKCSSNFCEVIVNHPIIIVAGATGDLGGRLVRELKLLNASVRCLVRKETSEEKKKSLTSLAAEVLEVDYTNHAGLTESCRGGAVVISALAGLRDVIVDAQSQLLEAAVAAGVPRFIPSDFSIDYTKIPEGSNRNLSLRSEFQKKAEASNIQLTSILNGAFAEMLTGQAPFILFNMKKVLCWGAADQLMDWTTMDDTAKYTAQAALDPKTPRFLRIAGDQKSALGLAQVMTALTGENFRVLKPGGLKLFGFIIRATKLFSPKSNDLYPPWQGMQYMHNMYSGTPKFQTIDNDRYPMKWTTTRDVLATHFKSSQSN